MFEIKYHLNGLVTKYKKKFIILKYSQILNIDFNKIFTLIVYCKSLKIFPIILTHFEFWIKPINIVWVFLENLIRDNKLPIFMKLLPKIKDF